MSSFLSGDALLNPELLRRFSDRVRESLERQPLQLDKREHQRELADLLARVGSLNHYEYLGIPETASEAEVHDAYMERARLVHPSHVERLSLEGLSGVPELLFEKATLAYLTLSDEDRRRAYHVEIGLTPATAGPVPVGDDRREEELDIAERNFQVAKGMAEEGEYFQAIELLYVSTRISQKAEYYKLLGECQAYNPKWRRKAIQSYARAIELDPSDNESRLASAQLYEADGNVPMARREYAALLERFPGHPDAAEALRRLGALK